MTEMISYFDEDYSISILVPEDWQIARSEMFTLHLIAPEESGYRSNLGFNRVSDLGPLDQAAFEQLVANTKADQMDDYNDFEQLDENKVMVDSRPAYLQLYKWADDGYQYTQILALIVFDEQTIFEIHGATLTELERSYIPIFERIIESIRFIPIERS